MTYTFDGVDINTFGAMPGRVSGEKLAISGIFDLPKRIGTTEYNWGTSIEPFVDEEDIELDGRTLTLAVIVPVDKTKAFIQKAIACTTLGTGFGDFKVIQKDEVTVEPHNTSNVITTEFYQYEYERPQLMVQGSGGIYSIIDSYSLSKDFGIWYTHKSGMQNTAKRIDVSTTDTYINTGYREARDLSISCNLKADTTLEAYTKMMQFHALCLQRGMHTFVDAGNNRYNVYFKDGITCKLLNEGIISFDLKMRCLNDG